MTAEASKGVAWRGRRGVYTRPGLCAGITRFRLSVARDCVWDASRCDRFDLAASLFPGGAREPRALGK